MSSESASSDEYAFPEIFRVIQISPTAFLLCHVDYSRPRRYNLKAQMIGMIPRCEVGHPNRSRIV
ncbi:unnamed protein product [Larinioides sclopetarius]|uniref:Uncharacterized protein n=1 Tax=Larinioides sclopetarius TaxID=280406 RepID=A0AAV2ACA4_9ARAC